jgi:ParB family chromosome partitioning protein
VRDKLAALAEDVRAEGWAWVEAVPHMAYAERQAFQNAPRQRREPTAREARRIASLQTRLDKIDAELEEAYDAEDEDKAERWNSGATGRRGTASRGGSLAGLRPDVRAVAGAIVTLDRNGEAVIHRGLLREAEAKALRTLERCGRVSAAWKAKPGTTTKARTPTTAQGREPVRPAGAAVERPPHRRAANRSRPASARRAGRAGAWHGADRLAGQPLRPTACRWACASRRKTGWKAWPRTGRNRPPPWRCANCNR